MKSRTTWLFEGDNNTKYFGFTDDSLVNFSDKDRSYLPNLSVRPETILLTPPKYTEPENFSRCGRVFRHELGPTRPGSRNLEQRD